MLKLAGPIKLGVERKTKADEVINHMLSSGPDRSAAANQSELLDRGSEDMGKSERRIAKDRRKAEIEERRRYAEMQAEALQSAAPVMRAVEGGRGVSRDILVVNFSMAYGANVLLENADIKLGRGRRYGLVGRCARRLARVLFPKFVRCLTVFRCCSPLHSNGMGKTTLLRHISRGEVEKFPKDVSVMHVEQEVVGDDLTVLETVLRSNEALTKLMTREKELLAVIGDKRDEALVPPAACAAEPAPPSTVASVATSVTAASAPSATAAAASASATATAGAGAGADADADACAAPAATPSAGPAAGAGVAPPPSSASEAPTEKAPPTSRKTGTAGLKKARDAAQAAEVALKEASKDPTEELAEVYAQLEAMHVSDAEARAASILAGLGFTENPSQRDTTKSLRYVCCLLFVVCCLLKTKKSPSPCPHCHSLTHAVTCVVAAAGGACGYPWRRLCFSSRGCCCWTNPLTTWIGRLSSGWSIT